MSNAIQRISNVAKRVRVSLDKDLVTLGHRGQIVSVAAGYARNYLIPSRTAVYATAANVQRLSSQGPSAEAAQTEAEKRRLAAEASSRMARTKLQFKRQVAKDGSTLNSSVTQENIIIALRDHLGIGWSLLQTPFRVQLAQPIKSLGSHTVQVEYEGQPSTVVIDVVKR